MPSKLEEITAAARREVAEAKSRADMRELERRAAAHASRGFREALRTSSCLGVIAELKKASPSKGIIRADFPVAELARQLESGGATALSVLTNEPYFQGALRNLDIASSATTLPCLRKDFITDEFQMVEARAFGADAVLLIVAALTDTELRTLGDAARASQLDVLCEVHDAVELQRALNAGFDLIGANSRNLHTFQVDLNTALELAELMPASVVKVAESGIESGDDIARLRQAGYDAFLIGESLMRAPSPGEALKELLVQATVAR